MGGITVIYRVVKLNLTVQLDHAVEGNCSAEKLDQLIKVSAVAAPLPVVVSDDDVLAGLFVGGAVPLPMNFNWSHPAKAGHNWQQLVTTGNTWSQRFQTTTSLQAFLLAVPYFFPSSSVIF